MNVRIIMGNLSPLILLAAKSQIWLPPVLDAIKQSVF